MQGRIRKRGSESWEITIDLGRDGNGKRLRKFVNAKGTKADAQRRLRELLTALDKGMPLDAAKVSVAGYLDRWLRDYADSHTRPRTALGYRGVVTRYLAPLLGTVPLAKLSPQHIQALESEMLQRGLSPRTVLHAHRVLKEALKHAVQWHLVARNAADGVVAPKPQHKEMHALDWDGVQRLLDTVKDSPYAPAITFGFYTGMRRSEILALKWGDIDLAGGSASVTRTLHRIAGKGLLLMGTKTKKSRRRVALSANTVSFLRGHIANQAAQRLLAGPAWQDDGYVFTRADGRPLDPDELTHAFKSAVKKAKLPPTRFHDLRHTHATLMLMSGVHPKIVSERLGHSSVQITLDLYSHVLPGIQEGAAQAFDDAMDRAAVLRVG